MRKDWEVKKLGDICEISYGNRVVKSRDSGSLYPVYGGGGATFFMDTYNREDSVVISRFGMSPKCVRFVKGKFFLNDSGLSLIANKNILCQSYLDMAMFALNDAIYSLGKGAAQKNLDVIAFNKLNIKYPISLVKQQQIVEELNCLTSIIEKQKKQLEELDNLAQSIFYDMFGDPIENEKEWNIVKFRDIGNVQGGYAFKSSSFVDYGIPVLKIGNINSGFFKKENISFYKYDSTLKKYEIYPNDLVISMTGTVGKDDYGNICIIPFDYELYYLNQRNAKLIVSDSYNSLFLSYVLKDNKIKRELTKNSKGVRQANISNNDILDLNLISPPLPLQQQFASKIEAIEKQKELIKKSIKETEDLFNSRMDYYFN